MWRFCGVFVLPSKLPHFWRWTYHATPFTYLLEGFVGPLVHNLPVHCKANELVVFSIAAEQTCNSYAGRFVAEAGGYVETLADGMCGYCRFSTGEQWAASFSISYENRWRDLWIVCAYVAFNYSMVFLCTWLYVGGGKRHCQTVKEWFKKLLGLFKTRGR